MARQRLGARPSRSVGACKSARGARVVIGRENCRDKRAGCRRATRRSGAAVSRRLWVEARRRRHRRRADAPAPQSRPGRRHDRQMTSAALGGRVHPGGARHSFAAQDHSKVRSLWSRPLDGACAPHLTVIFPGKPSAPIDRMGPERWSCALSHVESSPGPSVFQEPALGPPPAEQHHIARGHVVSHRRLPKSGRARGLVQFGPGRTVPDPRGIQKPGGPD